EVVVVVVLAGIVEHRSVLAVGRLHDLLQGLALEFGPLDRVVSVGHIGLMVFVVMEFQRFLRHMRPESVMGIRQWGKRKGHGMTSENCGGRDLTEPLIEGSKGTKHPQNGKRRQPS